MISVCMATHNGEKYIKRQVDSILSQLDANDELIISDDGSVDDTLTILESYKDRRIRIYYGCYNSPIYNFENALKHANGDYIFLSDQDDIWLDDKVEVMMKNLLHYDCVISDAYVINCEGERIYESFRSVRKNKKGIVYNFLINGYLGCCMAFRKEILKIALPFPKDIPMHDIWIGTIASVCGDTIFIDDRLIEYRRHNSNSSSTLEKSRNNIFTKIRYRMCILACIRRRKHELKKTYLYNK